MPKRLDIKTILVLGAGPIVIGQACEFDYSGVQACKALKEEGYRVVLVNSNPATIMTDPATADAVYIEPLLWEEVAKIIDKERPEVLLPTMGGQTALNCALSLASNGVLEKYNVEMIGAKREAIDKAEDRALFNIAMAKIGLAVPRAFVVHTLEEAVERQKLLGFPTIIRPSFTMGGSGGGIAYNKEEFVEICERGFDLSPTNELLLDESLLGWKEYEMEVVRDRNDNCIIVCAIENFDPMGVHTGDSITVAPAQTLTDKEYQIMRNASLAVLREIGVETGGSNVQFGINPEDGRMVVIEMNPRVSRSSALASKATGFPIAKIAAKLAIGYTLDELQNDITGGVTPASFEPSIDYVVTKIPRFNFEKFPGCDTRLTTQMKSVGEVMAIGRTFQESLQKAMRSLEIGVYGFRNQIDLKTEAAERRIADELQTPGPNRLWFIGDAFRYGWDVEKVNQLTKIDPWFLVQIKDLIDTEATLIGTGLKNLDKQSLYQLKRKGFSDYRLAHLLGVGERDFRERRYMLGIRPVYKRVDTCAAEFATSTAYLYSTYEEENEAEPTKNKKIVVLGGGPNRIGQGIEFDYCCVHAAYAARDEGYESIMVNCNPETVSTDYDTSDRLYFEPLTLEDVLEIVATEQPDGLIVQYGGQTPLKLARPLEAAGVPIIGTSPDSIDRAEDRERFQQVIQGLGLKQPPNDTVKDILEAVPKANKIGYPLVVRPSYVLGGRAMEIVYNDDELLNYMRTAVQVSNAAPVLLDHFLNDAIEIDVDAVCDGQDVILGGIMQHIEQAGVHSGDSSCSLPAYSLSDDVLDRVRQQTILMAKDLKVIGLMNVQFAIQGDTIYVLEVNPRASRTVPFVSKATGVPLANIAARCMMGISLASQGVTKEAVPKFYSVKRPVFPFAKFQGADPNLGPEMKSTGEAMGTGATFAEAFAKGMLASNDILPQTGNVFISTKECDKEAAAQVAGDLAARGFTVYATKGTAKVIQAKGIACTAVNKVREGRPHIIDMIKNNEIHFIINTTNSKPSLSDSFVIRRSAVQYKIPYCTTVAGAQAMVLAMQHVGELTVQKIS
jgi:carbamoyl-phosphate synthase large subunit